MRPIELQERKYALYIPFRANHAFLFIATTRHVHLPDNGNQYDTLDHMGAGMI